MQQRAGEIDAYDSRTGDQAHGSDCQIRGSSAQVQYARTLGQVQRIYGTVTPSAIEPSTEDAVE